MLYTSVLCSYVSEGIRSADFNLVNLKDLWETTGTYLFWLLCISFLSLIARKLCVNNNIFCLVWSPLSSFSPVPLPKKRLVLILGCPRNCEPPRQCQHHIVAYILENTKTICSDLKIIANSYVYTQKHNMVIFLCLDCTQVW